MKKKLLIAKAEAMVAVIFSMGSESFAAKPKARKELERRAIKQLRFIAIGARVTYLNKTS